MAPAHSGGKKARPSRSVTVTYGVVSLTLLVVIATVALIVRPPSPPALAEFAPQADRTIDDAPDNQSSRFGSGSGACAAQQVGCEVFAEATTTTTTTTPPGPRDEKVNPADVRDCVGEPLRQTEDPQSPPCAEYWGDRDNGGATSRGVSSSEIRVGAASPNSAGASLSELAQARTLAEYFNRRFEFYGRKLVVVALPAQGNQPESQRAAADAAYEAQVFAHVGNSVVTAASEPLRRQLAKHKIVSVAPLDVMSEADAQAMHPYIWNYGASFDLLSRNFAEFACKSLVGHPAVGGPGVNGTTRSFAVLSHNEGHSSGRVEIGTLADGLKRCPAPVRALEYKSRSADQTGHRLLLKDLQDQGVTTIIPTGHAAPISELMEDASSWGYQPEWFLPGGSNTLHMHEWNYQKAPPEQTAHLMAFGGPNKGLPAGDRPATWAFQEVGAGIGDDRNYSTYTTANYRQMLVLASGIQAAGPGLTPDTLAKGLQSLKFPNPGAGAAPSYQATVGFAGDHSMVDDMSLMWWSPAAPAYEVRAADTGGWCYIDRGARWRLGQWPKKIHRFFDDERPCR